MPCLWLFGSFGWIVFSCIAVVWLALMHLIWIHIHLRKTFSSFHNFSFTVIIVSEIWSQPFETIVIGWPLRLDRKWMQKHFVFALKMGQYPSHGKKVISSFDKQAERLDGALLWVKLPRLSIEFLSMEVFKELRNSLGQYLEADMSSLSSKNVSSQNIGRYQS